MYSITAAPIKPMAVPISTFIGTIVNRKTPSYPNTIPRHFGNVSLLDEVIECSDSNIYDLDLSSPGTSVYITVLWYVKTIQTTGMYQPGDTFKYTGPRLQHSDYLPAFVDDDVVDHCINLLDSAAVRGRKSSLIAYNNGKEGHFTFDEALFIKLPFIGQNTFLTYAYICNQRKQIYNGHQLRTAAKWHARVGAQHVIYYNKYGHTAPLFGCYRLDYSTAFMYNVFSYFSEDVEVDFMMYHPAGPGII